MVLAASLWLRPWATLVNATICRSPALMRGAIDGASDSLMAGPPAPAGYIWKTSDLIVTGTVPDGSRTAPRSM